MNAWRRFQSDLWQDLRELWDNLTGLALLLFSVGVLGLLLSGLGEWLGWWRDTGLILGLMSMALTVAAWLHTASKRATVRITRSLDRLDRRIDGMQTTLTALDRIAATLDRIAARLGA
jgi:hypothetical protein